MPDTELPETMLSEQTTKELKACIALMWRDHQTLVAIADLSRVPVYTEMHASLSFAFIRRCEDLLNQGVDFRRVKFQIMQRTVSPVVDKVIDMPAMI